jgi:Plant transposon protein
MLYASDQGARKSVERVFGVLFARFHVLCKPSRLWYKEDMADVVAASCIIHNMIIAKSEVQGGTRNVATLDDTAFPSGVHRVQDPQGTYERAQFWRGNADMVEDAGQHMALQSALADRMWDTHGNVYEPS